MAQPWGAAWGSSRSFRDDPGAVAMNTDERIARIAVLSRRLRWGIWAIVGVLAVAVFAVLLIASGCRTGQRSA